MFALFMQYANYWCYLWHVVNDNCVGSSLEVFHKQVLVYVIFKTIGDLFMLTTEFVNV